MWEGFQLKIKQEVSRRNKPEPFARVTSVIGPRPRRWWSKPH